MSIINCVLKIVFFSFHYLFHFDTIGESGNIFFSDMFIVKIHFPLWIYRFLRVFFFIIIIDISAASQKQYNGSGDVSYDDDDDDDSIETENDESEDEPARFLL